MIKGAMPTIFVSDMDRAVNFYTDTLGMKIQQRVGNDWCSIDAGDGLTLGLHPAGPNNPKPGSRGGISIGLGITGPLDDVVKTLKDRGVAFEGEIIDDDPGRFALFGDPDGNEFYLWESKK
ncbi:MAG: VOC family protein [candidate division Zixibacteria bacterium]|nr:VOC family protein [candidate division Zixibacteria bacterium]